MYITDTINVSNNGVINNGGRPQNFALLDTGTTDVTLTVGNNGTFVGTLYAPNATFNLSNNATYRGAFVANAIGCINNCTVCYDQTLGNPGGTPMALQLIMQWLVPSS
jgi:hypothetical protein